MYESHFHFDRRPFAATPDPGCCFLSPTQSPLFQTVGRCIDNGQGIAILTGSAGIGKTLLVQVLLAEATTRFTGVYLGTGQFPTRRALLQAILYELGQPYGGMTDQELRLELNTTLRNLITQRDGLLLILDEAHLLSDRLLEEVRLVADLAQHGVPLTRVVLSGNPEFEERLTSPSLAAFNQRVACHVALETLTQQESISYLEHRVSWAGGQAEQIFERSALQLMAQASDGVPRCLNQLADHALSRAFHAGTALVTESIVRQALAEVQHLSLRWNPSALHERKQRPVTDVPAPQPGPSATAQSRSIEESVPAEVLEFGAPDESQTTCFEFGAGDSTPVVEQAAVPRPAAPRPACSAAPTVHPSTVETEPVETEPEETADDDGPPLFAWLAKPAEPVPRNAGDGFSSSSFTIPTRARGRSLTVEQEVVSSAPLTGAELIGRRGLEAVRPALPFQRRAVPIPSTLPSEEVVVDAYARLDASRTPSFPRSAPVFPAVEIPSTVRAADIPADDQTTESTGVDVPAPAVVTQTKQQIDLVEVIQKAIRPGTPHSSSSPMERIDAICSLLEETAEFANAASGVELITDYGVERIDIDLPSNTELPAGTFPTGQPTFDMEDWIGSTVIDVGREVQQKMVSSFPDLVDRSRAARIDQLLSGIQQSTRYDIVEPEVVETATAATPRLDERHERADKTSGIAVGVVPQPNHSYQNFFSTLRRRQTR